MKQMNTLLVDLDGTLVDSKEFRVHMEFIIRFFRWWKAYGKPWQVFHALHQIRLAFEQPDSVEGTNCFMNDERAIRAFSQAMKLEPEQARDLLDRSLKEIFPKLKKHFFPVPGASDFIHWAHSRYRMILATNPVWSPEIVEMRLNWGGLQMDLFQSFTHAGKMRACKPSLIYYQDLLDQERLNPESCLLVGNDMRKDAPAIHARIAVFILSEQSEAKQISGKTSKQGSLWTGRYADLQTILQNGITL